MSDAAIVPCPTCGTKNRLRAAPQGTPRCAKCHQPLPWIVQADEGTFGAEISASVPVLVDFWAPWCGPCRMVSPVLERLAGHFAGRLKLVKVNVDENQGLASRYGAMSIPLLVLLRNGAEVARQAGAFPEPQIRAWLEPWLSAGTGSQERAT